MAIPASHGTGSQAMAAILDSARTLQLHFPFSMHTMQPCIVLKPSHLTGLVPLAAVLLLILRAEKVLGILSNFRTLP